MIRLAKTIVSPLILQGQTSKKRRIRFIVNRLTKRSDKKKKISAGNIMDFLKADMLLARTIIDEKWEPDWDIVTKSY